jgi:Uma2 family endonuclease
MSMTTSPPRLITVDELVRLSARHYRVEVVDGELRIQDIEDMQPVGGTHVIVISNIYDLIKPYVKQHQLGLFLTDGLAYLLDARTEGLKGSRVPDSSFIRQGDLNRDWDLDRPYPGHPTLAIEVISPSESGDDILAKTGDFLDYGTEQVWVVYPSQRELFQYFADGRVRRYRGDDVIDVDALFPGLVLKLADLFVLPELRDQEG